MGTVKFYIFIILCQISFYCSAQLIPVIKPEKKPETPSKNVPASPTKTSTPRVSYATIKFISDADGILFIDGEKKGNLIKNTPIRISLSKGDYLFRAESGDGQDNIKWNYSVTETGIEKIQEISLQEIIKRKKILNGIEMVKAGNFAIGKYEVTQAQWQSVMGNNPSFFKGDNLPVENVSWNDVQDFLVKLNQLTGKRYRLPTEVEWAYAARGGQYNSRYEYAGSNDIGSVAWYKGNSGNQTHPVGQKQPNDLGIYDMSGNVWEWCSDWYDDTQKYRVIRGASWNGGPAAGRVAFRSYITPDFRSSDIGFRLALSL